MFRAQANIFDDVVGECLRRPGRSTLIPAGKATDENLTSENWGDIMVRSAAHQARAPLTDQNVCDKVTETETGPRDAVQAVIKRLGHRNANVQLYTLELANALSQNCGAPLHRELASRSFTDALLRLAAERPTHQKVKAKIVERMAEWAEMFAGNPDLGIMEQAYMKLKAQSRSSLGNAWTKLTG
jgi:signal transducing adaptor molecule